MPPASAEITLRTFIGGVGGYGGMAAAIHFKELIAMKIRGIFLDREKSTEKSVTIAVPLPEKVIIPMTQCKGQECTPVVKQGEWVFAGTKIGDGSRMAPIHSSVSGRVAEIRNMYDSWGNECSAVVIEADSEQKTAPSSIPSCTDRTSFIDAVRASGCITLDGTAQDTAALLEKAHDADTLIVNGTESQQYITNDLRCMMDNADDILSGIRLIVQYMGIQKTVIALSADFKDAVSAMEKLAQGNEGISVMPLRADHPNGAEPVLVNNVTGRQIHHGETAADQKVLVLDTSTVAFIGEYFRTGMPMIKRRITVDGDLVRTPCSVEIPIGMPISEVLAFADTNLEAAEKLIIGGLMNGRTITDPELPMCKGDNALLVFMKPIEAGKGRLRDGEDSTACIRCGRCVEACPMGLMPLKIEKAFDKKRLSDLKRLRPDICISCGNCSYVCPAKRDLTNKVIAAAGYLDRRERD